MIAEKQVTTKYKLELTEQEAKDIVKIMKLHDVIYKGIVLETYSDAVGSAWDFEDIVYDKVVEIGNITSAEIIKNLVL